MEITSATSSLGADVGMAVQKKVLDQMRTDGQEVVNLIASGSFNSPTQGRILDVRA
jgi:hypothetical protein